jgi:hypothetical protein
MASHKNDEAENRHRTATAAADAPAQTAIAAGTWPSPIDTFRTQVQGTTLVGLINGDEKTPYPTGGTVNPPGSRFWLRRGFYKSATPT